MLEHIQPIRWQQTTKCLSVFNHFVGLVLKGLKLLCFEYGILEVTNKLDAFPHREHFSIKPAFYKRQLEAR